MQSLARMRIVSINDVYELHNLPRLQTFLSKLKPAASAVVLAGDFLSPSTLSSIDGGRGMVATLRAMGLTHASLGNHERDLRLTALHDRLADISKSVEVLNTNMRENIPPGAEWFNTITIPYSIVQSSCKHVNVALLGLMSDEAGVFRDNTFKGIPIANVCDTYSSIYQQLVPDIADLCIPLSHESIVRDKELAEHMLMVDPTSHGLIIGGHEHVPYDEIVGARGGQSVRIVKSGSDAKAAELIDLTFDLSDMGRPKLAQVDAELVEMSSFEPSVVVQKIVDKHMSVVKALEDEDIIDDDSTAMLPPGMPLSSARTRYQQTTVGAVFCQMIKEELEVDVAIINGATIKGDKLYPYGRISYAELKKELPFPTKLVVVPMERVVLEEAIHFSRNSIEDGVDRNLKEIPRRGYLQVDWDYSQTEYLGYPDDVLQVALPRNLLNGFCNNEPLMAVGARLKAEGLYPGEDDFVPALDVVVRHACKNRWFHIISEIKSFKDFDLNDDGVLDRYEIKKMMENLLGHEPPDFVVDDMIASIDTDENGVIDQGEFSFLLAKMERELKMF